MISACKDTTGWVSAKAQIIPAFSMLRSIKPNTMALDPFSAHHLMDLVTWMKRYTERSKREMDLADATLYWLATETGVHQIMTTDVRDFSRYRLPSGESFSIL